MPRLIIALLLCPLVAFAAPVPKAKTKAIEDVFGTPVERSGVTCQMTRKDELKATVSKEAATADRDSHGRPLATRVVEGDFVLTVRVTQTPPAAADLAAGDGGPAVTAGIALFADGNPKSTLVLLQKHFKKGDTWTSGLSMSTQHRNGGSGTGRQNAKLEDQPVYLRLTRTGDEFKAETSGDGKKWQGFGTHKVPGFGGAVVVGPYAGHNTTAEHEVTFDEYVIQSSADEKK
jgi:hypothetical protein